MARSIDPESRRIGVRLKMLRCMSERSVDEIAAELGITPAAWYHWETGRSRVYLVQIPHIAAALRLPKSYVSERLQEEYPRETDESESQRDRPRQNARQFALAGAY